MKLTLELNNGQKVVVENKNVNNTEYDISTLSIEYLWEQLKTKIEQEPAPVGSSKLKDLLKGLNKNG
jgi:hypothetical protein